MAEANNTGPVSGRKVFFVNTSFAVTSTLVPELRDREFEVYTVESYKDIKNMLRQNPDSICLFNTDSQLSPAAWVSFFRSFKKEIALRSAIIGILSDRMKEGEDHLFKDENVEYKAGIHTVGKDLNVLTNTMEMLLTDLGAKGRRQYVRVSCFKEKKTLLFWMSDTDRRNIMHQMKILDISSMTVAVKVPETLERELFEGKVLSSCNLVLNSKQTIADLRVFMIKKTPHGKVAILLLDDTTGSPIRTIIKKFIAETLQNNMILSINDMSRDNEDYAEQAKIDKLPLE